MQTRLVRCILEGVNSSSCSETDEPVAQQRCNAEPCGKEATSAKELASRPPKSKEISLLDRLFYQLKRDN